MESKTSCLINSSRRFAAKAFASASSASTDWSFPRLSASADFGSSSVGFSSGFSSIVAFFSVMVLGFSSGLGMASGTSPLAISSGLAYPSSAKTNHHHQQWWCLLALSARTAFQAHPWKRFCNHHLESRSLRCGLLTFFASFGQRALWVASPSDSSWRRRIPWHQQP